MRLIAETRNLVAFLLVGPDGVNPITDSDPAKVSVKVSMGGSPFILNEEPIHYIGEGWFTTWIDTTGVTEPNPVLLLGYSPDSLMWRDIHEIVNLEPAPWSEELRLEIQKMNDALLEMTEQISQVAQLLSVQIETSFQAIMDALSQVKTPEGKTLDEILTGLRITRLTVDEPTEPPEVRHSLVGVPVTSGSIELERPHMQAHSNPEGLLGVGEHLGPDLVPIEWRRHDSEADSHIVNESRHHITIQYGADGTNQQVYKVIDPVPSGDFILCYRIDTLDDSRAEVRLHRHTKPYTPAGYHEEHDSGDSVLTRTRLDLVEGERTRIQFQFGGLHLPMEIYTISEVHLWRVETNV